MGDAMDEGDEDIVRLTAWVRGHVQGVGFRWWVRARALELGLAGSAANLADGRVEVVAEGTRRNCRRLLDLLDGDVPASGRAPRPPGRPGKVTGVISRWSEPRGEGSGFHER